MKHLTPIKGRDEQAPIRLAVKIACAYFLTVCAIIFTIEYHGIALYSGLWNSSPVTLIFLVWFLYYLLPVILAVICGLFFRPFGRVFRNIYFSILFIQLFYSFVICMLRWDYLENFERKKNWKKSDRVKIEKLSYENYDRNHDGLIEEIRIAGIFDFSRIRKGEYLLDASIVPGASLSPFAIEGGGVFVVEKPGDENKIAREFVVTPKEIPGHLAVALQNFQVKFLLFRIMTVDDYGKKILAVARWAPFLRSVDWQGVDREIYSDWVLLDTKVDSKVFSMQAPVLSPTD